MAFFSLLLATLIAYIAQPKPSLPRSFIALFAALDTVYLFALYKQLCEKPITAATRRSLPRVEAAGALSQPRLGFSRAIVERAEAILAPLATREAPAPAVWQRPSAIRPRTPPTERSMLDGVSFEWPESLLAAERRAPRPRPSAPVERASSSFSRRRSTASKASAGGKTDPKERSLSVQEISEADQRLTGILAQRNINLRLFYSWAEGRMQQWFCLSLAPEIARRNLANLKAINDLLLPFAATLRERPLFERAADGRGDEFAPNIRSAAPNPSLRPVSLDDLLSLSIDSVQQWGSLLRLSPENAPSLSETLTKLSALIGERVALDGYLCPREYRVELVRLHCFRQVLHCKPEQGQPTEIRKRFPSEAETLINAFIACLTEYSQFYAAVPFARERIFIDKFLGAAREDETQLLIETGNKSRFTCVAGRAFVPFPSTVAGAFSAMAFIACHAKYVQSGAPRPGSAYAALHLDFNVREDVRG